MEINSSRITNPYFMAFVKVHGLKDGDDIPTHKYLSWIDKKHTEFRKIKDYSPTYSNYPPDIQAEFEKFILKKEKTMTMLQKAVEMNPDGMDADVILALHCPLWYGFPNIDGCPRPVTYTKGKKTILSYEKALDKCKGCWNRRYQKQSEGEAL